MKKLIEVNGVQIQEGLCSVEFQVSCTVFNEIQEITHAKAYQLIDTADKVEENNNPKESLLCKVKHGGLELAIFLKKNL